MGYRLGRVARAAHKARRDMAARAKAREWEKSLIDDQNYLLKERKPKNPSSLDLYPQNAKPAKTRWSPPSSEKKSNHKPKPAPRIRTRNTKITTNARRTKKPSFVKSNQNHKKKSRTESVNPPSRNNKSKRLPKKSKTNLGVNHGRKKNAGSVRNDNT